ncbi:MAG: hypothetical protein BHK79_02745 [Halanaerobium sp. MDAL1]|nr:MAG: hypothetical protein BHK79_02745 [Halanaerobium sp. MDAL1]
MSIPGGYILLSRKLIESEIFDKPPMYLKVWVYLLSRAQFKEHKRLERGQLFTNIPEIQEACSWYVGYRKETPSKSKIYRIIDWLRKTGERADEGSTNDKMIETSKATQGMVITILNYSYYQDPTNYDRNADQNNENETTETRPKHSRNNINKECSNNVLKNDKELNNIVPKSEIEKIYNSLSDYWKPLFEDYIDIYRQKNKTKKITDNKHLRLLKELKTIFKNKSFEFDGQNYNLTDQVFEKGINAIVEKQIDNLNYAKQVWISKMEKAKKREDQKSKKREKVKSGNYQDRSESNDENSYKWKDFFIDFDKYKE